MKQKRFATEAELCASFTRWVSRTEPGIRCYAEWASWDLFLVFKEGWQLGIQAKLRLNAEVILQTAPSVYDDLERGPDFRGILVPEINGMSAVASELGLVVFSPLSYRADEFLPDLMGSPGYRKAPDWLDWNPRTRHEIPATETGSVAGSSAPVTLTTWKLKALAVLAELEVSGSITAKRIREIGIDPGRWCQQRWLEPVDGRRGFWERGAKCPRFDEQHAAAYELALGKAREISR